MESTNGAAPTKPPLRLMGADERTTVEISGTKFVLRKVPHAVSSALTRKFTRRGILDEEAFERALWLHVLVGWEGLHDAAGNLLPFSTDRVAILDPLTGEPAIDGDGRPRMEPLPFVVAMGLPHDLAENLIGKAKEPTIAVHVALGNSGPSSANA